MRSFYRFLNLLAVGIFSLMIVIPLCQKGMFLDGVNYAAIVKNLSLHYEKIWDLFYAPEVLTHFFEHPPFVFWLQS